MKNKTNKDSNCEYINFSGFLQDNYADATTPPAFDGSTASVEDKKQQWLYYFTQHADEVNEVLDGTEDELSVCMSWLKDNMPTFAEAIRFDDLTAGSYISIGNKTLRTLCIEGHEPRNNAHIRFSDNTGMDEIAKAVKAEEIKAQEKYGTDAQQQAQKLILDPAFFYKLGKDLEQGFFLPGVNRIRYILGEESLKRQIAIHMVASRWGHDTINILSGGFATVKDTLVKMIFQLTGTQFMQRGYLTAAGMRYSKTMQDANVLYLPEADIAGEKGRQMRLMRSDDAGFKYEYAFKNAETGKMETESGKVDAKTIIITTNDVSFDPALVSGGWVFNTDDSKELTQKVIKEKLKGFTKDREILNKEDLTVWHCAFDILTNMLDIPLKISIPYAENLSRLFNTNQSQSRRSPEKLGELIQDVAILRRYQKPEEKRDSADLIDLFLALRIGVTAIAETISEASSKEIAIFNIVSLLDEYSEGVSAKEIAMKATYASNTCYILAEALTTKGYLAKGKRGRENVYSIKNELDKGSDLCLTHLQSLDKPIVVLKECLCLVYPFLNSSISDKTCTKTKEGYSGLPSKVTLIDPLKGTTLTVTYLSEIEEIEISESKNPSGAILDTLTFKVFIREQKSLEHTNTPTESGEIISKKKDKPSKVRAGISLGDGIEYEKIGGDVQ
jgi:hypothetical protein